MFSYSLLLYPYGNHPCGHYLCLGSAFRRGLHRRGIRSGRQYGPDGHTGQYDGQRCDGGIYPDAYFTGRLYGRHTLLCKRGAEPGINDNRAEHLHLYDHTVHLLTDRHGADATCGHDLCLVSSDNSEHHGRGISRSGPGGADGYADQYKHDSGGGHGDL